MNLHYWVWLQQALGYGSKYTSRLLEHFGSAEEIFKAKQSDIAALGIKNKKIIENLNTKRLNKATEIIKDCKKNGILIIQYNSESYPDALREIPAPPIVLYAKGDISLLKEETTVCIVGPRKVSVYGKKAAFSLSARLALCGFTVVSGGALGCDTAAHKGALLVDGKTVCFLGSGIASDYLPINKPLRDKIAEKGLLVSEYPPYYAASKYTFPVRNRLMAGFTLGTVIVEAGEKSGALITANAAVEQSRDVFVIPGNPTDPNYKGSNKLLRDGAKPLLELGDIITEYLPLYPHKINPEKAYSKALSMNSEQKSVKATEKEKNTKKTKKIIKENLSNNAKIVYNQLDKQIFYLDELDRSVLSDSQILAAITELEIFGYIKALPGGKYGLENE